MKNIIVILQRAELNYLIKYDSIRIASDRIINLTYEEFKQLSDKQKIAILQNSLPIYEQEHEVFLIEYHANSIGYDNGPILEFKGIYSLIPLSEIGARLLSSKLNTDFNVLKPLESKLYKSFINNRSHLLRYKAGQQLCSLYQVPNPKEEFITDFKTATLFQLNEATPNGNDSTLAHLIDFNITPSFIPEGNIEAVIKAACVGMKKLNKEVDQITRSTFYSFVIKEKSAINSKTLYKAIQYIEEKTDLDNEEKTRFNKLKNTLSENGKYANAFLLFSYFYFLKKQIEKNDYNISIAKDDILELKHYDSEVASKVLFMLGYTFSIQTISKSIQSFSKSRLLKTQKNLDLDWSPKEVVELKSENKKSSQEEKPVVVDLLIKEKQNLKPLSDLQNSNDKTKLKTNEESTKDKNEFDVDTSTSKQLEEEKTPIENKINEEAPPSIVTFSNIKKPDSDLFSKNIKTKNKSLFTFQEFENILKKRKSFLSKIVNALKAIGIQESEITEEILIKCLEDLDEYKKQNGGLKVNAKESLKIFE
ncbi:hypothetical protein [Cellulophaga sp. L1A9]|uniref:hypothetical protein n=1 Tax=Cellulophaga sp. L1A9 TaxID=2686362 RepID=UPI00131D5FDC|nr:hypothetical protein [Cellulophaga sp. L1A9]